MRNKYLFYATYTICIFNLITAHSETIRISSEKLNIHRVKNISVFTGNVYAEDEEIKLWSDKISMYYDENKDSVKEIIAENNVKIIIDGITAFGNYSEYKVYTEELILEGDVIVIENNNKIESDQLILDLANSTSIMTANTDKRVTAQINTLNNEE